MKGNKITQEGRVSRALVSQDGAGRPEGEGRLYVARRASPEGAVETRQTRAAPAEAESRVDQPDGSGTPGAQR